jgi:hypothetical protein
VENFYFSPFLKGSESEYKPQRGNEQAVCQPEIPLRLEGERLGEGVRKISIQKITPSLIPFYGKYREGVKL